MTGARTDTLTAALARVPLGQFPTPLEWAPRCSAEPGFPAVWIKQATASPAGGFPAATIALQNNLGAIVRIIHNQFPNVRLAYFPMSLRARRSPAACWRSFRTMRPPNPGT